MPTAIFSVATTTTGACGEGVTILPTLVTRFVCAPFWKWPRAEKWLAPAAPPGLCMTEWADPLTVPQTRLLSSRSRGGCRSIRSAMEGIQSWGYSIAF
jgi:hypothetical protein